jgi:hypothetical protein
LDAMSSFQPPGVYHEGTAEWKAQQHGDPYVPERLRIQQAQQQQAKQPKTRTMWYHPGDAEHFANSSPSDFFR